MGYREISRPSNDAAIVGGLIGLSMVFTPVRYMFIALVTVCSFLFIQDKLSEHTYPGTDTSKYEFRIKSLEEQFVTGEAQYYVKYELVNNTEMFLQSFYIIGTLYECPTENSALSECIKLDRDRQLSTPNQPAGFLTRDQTLLSFREKVDPNRHYVVEVGINDITFDDDRTER